MSSLMYHHSKFLGAQHGNLYLTLKGKQWNRRDDHSFLLVTMRMLRLIGCLILILERSYFDGMSSLMRALLQFITHLQRLLHLPLLPPLFQVVSWMMRMMIMLIPIYLHHRILPRCLNGLELQLRLQDLQLVTLPLPITPILILQVLVFSLILSVMILRHLHKQHDILNGIIQWRNILL